MHLNTQFFSFLKSLLLGCSILFFSSYYSLWAKKATPFRTLKISTKAPILKIKPIGLKVSYFSLRANFHKKHLLLRQKKLPKHWYINLKKPFFLELIPDSPILLKPSVWTESDWPRSGKIRIHIQNKHLKDLSFEVHLQGSFMLCHKISKKCYPIEEDRSFFFTSSNSY